MDSKKGKKLFSSESVSPGHPDKVADQISDAILDEVLAQDPKASVACEVMVKTGLVLVGGEISTTASLEVETVVRRTLQEIGYTYPELGFDAESCSVLSALGKQSPDIARGVWKEEGAIGAGDQGTVFGFAIDETDSLMPAPIFYAHRLMQEQAACFKLGKWSWLRPDAKAQVTLSYEGDTVTGLHSCVFSTQHTEDISLAELREAVIEEIIKPAFPPSWIHKDTLYRVNPAGKFVEGGPKGDCGLTGRKLMVDTYGGMARHGGGAFSGKDPSKVDRSAAYMARKIAKTLVASGLAKRCEVQISYAIGVPEPIALFVDSFGTAQGTSDEALTDWVTNNFDLTPSGIIKDLKLLEAPKYRETSVFGHFGRENFSWEEVAWPSAHRFVES